MQEVVRLTRVENQSSIACTSNRNDVVVDGAPKTCRAFFENEDVNHPRILCYSQTIDGKPIDGFMALSQDDQYFQIHHELAVLAGIEDKMNDRSNYPLSSQITSKLTLKTIKVLPITETDDSQPASHCSLSVSLPNENYDSAIYKAEFMKKGYHLVDDQNAEFNLSVETANISNPQVCSTRIQVTGELTSKKKFVADFQKKMDAAWGSKWDSCDTRGKWNPAFDDEYKLAQVVARALPECK